MRSRTPIATPRVRRQPDLADDLAAWDDTADHWRSGDIHVSDRKIEGLALPALASARLRLERCVLDHVSFSGGSLAACGWRDVRFRHCDLGNLDVCALTAVRVEFTDCRMTGFRAQESHWQDVLILEGDQRYAQFRFAKFKSAEFEACDFEEGDFEGADLQGSVFRRCNLRRAEMTGAKLKGAVLKGSKIEGLRINAQDVHGAIVDPTQAMILAPLLGIRIE